MVTLNLLINLYPPIEEKSTPQKSHNLYDYADKRRRRNFSIKKKVVLSPGRDDTGEYLEAAANSRDQDD
jgi:hypothetical protein